jgi:hypothetical protein
MPSGTPQLRTPGVIAEELGEPLGRVLYVLRTRGHLIKPIGRAGVLRLYSPAAVEMVRQALREIEQRQSSALAGREGR